MNTKFWNVIGLMSRTSLDGVDIVYTRISKTNKVYDFEIIVADTIPYSEQWIPKLLGFEFIKEIIFPLIETKQLKVKTVLRTFVAHILACLVPNSTSKVLVTNSGAFNTFLINELKK